MPRQRHGRRYSVVSGTFRSPGTAPAPCKAHLHGTGSHTVGRWSQTVGVTVMGVWGFPQTVSGCALSATGNRGGSVVLENGEQKHARDFEVGKRAMEQCRIDNPMSNVNNLNLIVRLPLALKQKPH